jgi:hypothetical protein
METFQLASQVTQAAILPKFRTGSSAFHPVLTRFDAKSKVNLSLRKTDIAILSGARNLPSLTN